MNDDYRGSDRDQRMFALTKKRVADMSDAERAALARELRRGRGALTGAPARPAVRSPDARPPGRTPVDGQAQAAARLTAELRKTQRHLERHERSITSSRYGGVTSGPGTARYAYLLSRADRIERQLRKLR